MKHSFYKTIHVPRDLSHVTSYKPTDEVNPVEAGMTQRGVHAIWRGVKDLYRTGIHPAISFCLLRQGKIVLKRAIGHAKGNGPDDDLHAEKIQITPETPICLFSISKSVTAMLVHLLVEEGQINLLDPVSRYIPEFGQMGKKKITVYHLLSHRGGIPRIPCDVAPEILFDHDAFVKLLCESKPAWPEGHRMAYHAITSSFILAEILIRVTGKDIRELLRDRVQKPLGFRYFNYGVSDEDIPQVAVNYYTGLPAMFPVSRIIKHIFGALPKTIVRISNDPCFMKKVIPAGNIISTAEESAKFFQLLLNRGELNGVRIFNPITVNQAVIETGKSEFDYTVMFPMRYSAGMVLGGNPIGIYGPFTQHAYGHIGFMNNFCWADPERDIAVSLLTTGKAILGWHLMALARLLAFISWNCPKHDKKQ